MLTSILERTINTADLQSTNVHDISIQVSKLLNYNKLIKQDKKTSELLNLISLGFSPFTEKSVDLYKNKMIDKARRKLLKIPISWCIAGISLAISQYFIMSTSVNLVCIMLGVFSFIIGLGSLTHKFNYYEVKWSNVDISHYELPIPINILKTAIDIKQKFPNCSIQVDQLIVNKIPADPFLIVKFPGGSNHPFYIEVWDEPTFKDLSDLDKSLV